MNFDSLCTSNLEQHAEIALARLTEAQRQLETARSEAPHLFISAANYPTGQGRKHFST